MQNNESYIMQDQVQNQVNQIMSINLSDYSMERTPLYIKTVVMTRRMLINSFKTTRALIQHLKQNLLQLEEQFLLSVK